MFTPQVKLDDGENVVPSSVLRSEASQLREESKRLREHSAVLRDENVVLAEQTRQIVNRCARLHDILR